MGRGEGMKGDGVKEYNKAIYIKFNLQTKEKKQKKNKKTRKEDTNREFYFYIYRTE